MNSFWIPISALVWKDLLLELRTRDIVISVVIFALLVVVIFNFALNPTPNTVVTLAPGILWVAFTFGGVLGLNRSFAREKDKNSLEGLMLCPVSRDTLFFGKMLAIFLFMLVVEALLVPIFTALFNVSLFMPEFILIAVLTTLGFAAVGTVFSAMAMNTRSREIMLPLLFFPVVMPLLIAAVEGSGVIIGGESWANVSHWLQLIVVFDIIFLVISSFAFQFVLEE